MTQRYETTSFTKLPLSHAGFVRILTLGFCDSRPICPDSKFSYFLILTISCPDCTRPSGPKSAFFVRIVTWPFLLSCFGGLTYLHNQEQFQIRRAVLRRQAPGFTCSGYVTGFLFRLIIERCIIMVS
jgi:hypothetical protein